MVRKTESMAQAWASTAKMHNTRWTPDEFVEELCIMANSPRKKEKMVALAKEFIDLCVYHNYMKKISLLLLGISKNIKDVNLLAELLAYCGKLGLRDYLEVKLDDVGKKIQVYTLDHLWYNLYGNSLEPIHGIAVHPNSLINREKLLRYVHSNWPTARRVSYKTFCDGLPLLEEDRTLLKFLYCKYYLNRIKPKSVIVYFDTTRCSYSKGLGFNYRLVSNCGKYVIYLVRRLKQNSYFELLHNNEIHLLSEEDLRCLEL